MITHRQVEAFRHVMATGTATAAANVMNISQPAVSRLITSLEYELGFPLFERRNRHIHPTGEALQFHDAVEQSFVGLERLSQAAADIQQNAGRRLNLVCIPSLSTNVAVELIRHFHGFRPNVAVSLDVQPSQRIFEWISTGKCELGLTSLPIHAPMLEKQVIATGLAECIVPPGHRLCGRSVAEPTDLVDETFIGYRADSEFRQHLDTLFGKAAAKRRVVFEGRTTNCIVSMVAAGLGLSVVEPSFALRQKRSGVVSIGFLPEISVDLTLIRSSQRTLSQSAALFEKIAANYFR